VKVTTRTPTALLLVLALAYALIFVPVDRLRQRGFDPLAARPRVVEELLSAGQFAQALPLALELRTGFPREPEVLVWLAAIHHGLHDDRAEAAAWEEYLRMSSVPAAACPALPDAYTRIGSTSKALAAFERCLQQSPNDPDRMVDLAAAYEKAGRANDAVELYRQAAALDPYDPALAEYAPGEGRP
jgi:tetratricopeptide (TPR) repeat protein